MKVLLAIILGIGATVNVHAQDSSTYVTHYRDVYIKSVDTIAYSYRQFDFTLRYDDNGGDTAYEYNHVEFTRRRAEREMAHWRTYSDKCWKKYDKTNGSKHLVNAITAVKRIEYWQGVYDALSMVEYRPYDKKPFTYEFKVK